MLPQKEINIIKMGERVEIKIFILAKDTLMKDVAPYSVVGGNPATEIKKRFPQETIEKLLKLQWWNWDIKKITKNVQLLTGNSTESLL